MALNGSDKKLRKFVVRMNKKENKRLHHWLHLPNKKKMKQFCYRCVQATHNTHWPLCVSEPFCLLQYRVYLCILFCVLCWRTAQKGTRDQYKWASENKPHTQPQQTHAHTHKEREGERETRGHTEHFVTANRHKCHSIKIYGLGPRPAAVSPSVTHTAHTHALRCVEHCSVADKH